ncbi:hypothetical protein BD309DRAFT_968241 [Dichomitus squalens]|nr:hypothetical protein BD309DRAFT_968241 [Dichomitus squalens]
MWSFAAFPSSTERLGHAVVTQGRLSDGAAQLRSVRNRMQCRGYRYQLAAVMLASQHGVDADLPLEGHEIYILCIHRRSQECASKLASLLHVPSLPNPASCCQLPESGCGMVSHHCGSISRNLCRAPVVCCHHDDLPSRKGHRQGVRHFLDPLFGSYIVPAVDIREDGLSAVSTSTHIVSDPSHLRA